jgi:flagellar biosynthetic protein FliQ
MNEDLVIALGGDALKTTAMLASPLLLGALVTGLIVSIFQAITQINEATLTFIPKMLIVALILVLAGPWMIDTMKQYTIQLYDNIHTHVREQ